jgi:hypothetical protein
VLGDENQEFLVEFKARGILTHQLPNAVKEAKEDRRFVRPGQGSLSKGGVNASDVERMASCDPFAFD